MNQINLFSLSKRTKRPLILDGAMGSLLQQRGFKPDSAVWMSLLNLKNPDLIFNIHKEYISAGADIITTNTFRTNPAAVKGFSKINLKKLVKESVNIALKAAKGLPIIVAGSNAPAEDCYQTERTLSLNELKKNHHTHIGLLLENGCHLILNETQSHFDEIKIICSYSCKNEIPYIVSLFFNGELKLLSGEDLTETLKYIFDKNPLALGFNCISPSLLRKAIKKTSYLLKDFNWGFYLNCLTEGNNSSANQGLSCNVTPRDYIQVVAENLKGQPSFIGACCGSSPEHIKELKKFFNAKN